jgi:phosphate/phosphite/phosphonate ABC transporter binding protein
MPPSNPSSSSGPALAIVLALALLIGTLTLLGSLTPNDLVPPEPQFEEGARGTRTLRFGRIPNVSPREAYRVYSGLVTLLEEQLPCCDVELVLAPDYASCVQMLAEKKIDLAWLGTATYVVERERTPMIPLVRPIWSGKAGYAGVIFTLEGSGIKELEDLRGKRLAFVDVQSASGYVYPANLLIAAGFDLHKDFAATDFLGSHDAVLMAVLLGEYDAGAVFERAYFTVADRARRMQLRVLAQTEPIPGEPIVAGAHLDGDLVDEVRAAFLRIQTERLQETALRDLFGFEPATDEQYTGVRLLEK